MLDKLACGVDFSCTVRMACGPSGHDSDEMLCQRCFRPASGPAAQALLSVSSQAAGCTGVAASVERKMSAPVLESAMSAQDKSELFEDEREK